MKYWHFFGQNHIFLIKTNEISTYLIPECFRWLAGCLAAWLPGCLAGWLAAWLPGCLAAWLLGCLAAGYLCVYFNNFRVVSKSNIWHWDRNYKFSLFLHNGNVFVFKINNSGADLHEILRRLRIRCQNVIWSDLKKRWLSQKSPRQAPAGADVPEKNEIKIKYDDQYEIIKNTCTKKQYLTLGPKLYFYLCSAITRRRKHLPTRSRLCTARNFA